MLLLLPIFVATLGMVGVWFGWPFACVLTPIPIGFVFWRLGTSAPNAAGGTIALSLLIALIIPAFDPSPHGPGRRARCMNNLSQIGKALMQYEAVHRRFPSPYTTDDNGQPLVSWRASILPQLGRQDVYEECHLNEPWDSPANAELNGYDLLCFRCPSDSKSLSGQTSYLAVVGPGTVWSTDEPVNVDDIHDASRTILLVEATDSGISWLEPRDLSLEDALRGINAEPGPSISGGHSGGVVVLFVDGHIEVLRKSIALSELRELLMVEKR